MGVEMTSHITVHFSFLTQLFPVLGPIRYVFQPWGYPIGLELAWLADLPEEVMVHAGGVTEKLSNLDKAKHTASKTTQAIACRKAVLRVHLHNKWLGDLHTFVDEEYLWLQLRTQLMQVYEHSALPDHKLSLYLAILQKEIIAVLGSVLDV
jgi:DNA mismatch repair protein MSH4